MTAVGPPDWPITALPERRSGTLSPLFVARENAPEPRALARLPASAHILCDACRELVNEEGQMPPQDRNLAGTAI